MMLIALVDFFALKYRQAKRNGRFNCQVYVVGTVFMSRKVKRENISVTFDVSRFFIRSFFRADFLKQFLHFENLVQRFISKIFYFRDAA